MPFFSKSKKSPSELVKSLKDAITILERGDKKADKAKEDVSKNLVLMRNMLIDIYEDRETDIIEVQLAQELYTSNLLFLLIKNLNYIDFEGRKDVAKIFNNILRRQIGSRYPTVEYICTKPEILFTLLSGYEHQEFALNCGTMLRECVRYEALAKMLLYSDDFYKFFHYVEVSPFDVASDAFSTFKELLTRHKKVCADFLEAHYEKVFRQYHQLLTSENYVTRWQSLKLLGELLVEEHNFSIMFRYVTNPDNLELIIKMLCEESRNIKFEAYEIFKVFVANPNKPKSIMDILQANQDKFIDSMN